MNTICIKTNNNNAINYLLEKLKKYDFNDISFSCRKFKVFHNLFLHYKGSDFKKFICNISSLLTSLIIDIYEDDIIKKIISSNYFYFNTIEQKEILQKFKYIRENDVETSYIKEKKLFNAFGDLLEQNKKIFLKGVITFRLFDYIQELTEEMDSTVNQYLIEKEYNEFVSLLRLYVNTETSRVNSVHLIYKDSSPILLDENKNIIKIESNMLNAKYLSDITFSNSDIALNTLLNILPKKIFIHLIDEKPDEFITTLELIFENRVVICTDCNICNIYKAKKASH